MRYLRQKLPILLFLLMSVTSGLAQSVNSFYEKSHALVIGNSEYQFWDKLVGAKADVPEVTKALREQGFTVETETNLTSANLKTRVEKFISDYGYIRDSRLLIYFAGHGATYRVSAEDREVGYIVPIDTPRLPAGTKISEQAEADFMRKAISMDTFDGWAKNVRSKHALFVFDSCFSGRFVPRSEIKMSEIVQDALGKPTRQFLTSGAANQTAGDNSEFRKAFIQGLSGDADLTGDGFVAVTELAIFVRDRVAEYSHGKQTPQYGTIREASLDGGDMVFEVSAEFTRKNSIQADLAWKRVIKNDANSLRAFVKSYPNTARGREAVGLLAGLEPQSGQRNALGSIRTTQPLSSTQMNTSSEQDTQQNSRGSLPAPTFSVTKDSITIELIKCELAGKEMICSFSIWSTGKDVESFILGSAKAIDTEGNEIENERDRNKVSSKILVDSNKISGTIAFPQANPKAVKIARLDIRYLEGRDWKDASFRNVPITRKN